MCKMEQRPDAETGILGLESRSLRLLRRYCRIVLCLPLAVLEHIMEPT